ncbi:MAG: hypothetical protein ACT6UU_24175, partial [Hydrogenophaga sp.]
VQFSLSSAGTLDGQGAASGVFHGGLIQLTGKDNYAAASYGCGLGMVLIHKPEAAADPSDACHIAAWYWQSRGCNQLIDAGDFHRTTRLINGAAMLHKHERAAAFHHTLAAFA